MLDLPQDYRVCRDAAVLLLQQGKIDGAFESLEAFPDRAAHVWNDLGVFCHERGMLEAAIACFEHAPEDADTACNLGVTLLEAGRTEEAVSWFRKVLARDPGHSRAHVLLRIEETDRGARLESRRLVPGQFVNVVRRVRFSGTDLVQEWQGRMHQVTDSTISISYPRVRPTTIPFRNGSRVMIGLAADECFWTACAEVEEPPSSEVPILALKNPGHLRKVQRREGVRVACSEETARVRGTDAAAEERLRDLSVSGVGLIALESPAENPLRMNLTLGRDLFEVQGRVVRREEVQKGLFLLGVAFLQIRNQVQDRISRFVNRVQLDRKRGLR